MHWCLSESYYSAGCGVTQRRVGKVSRIFGFVYYRNVSLLAGIQWDAMAWNVSEGTTYVRTYVLLFVELSWNGLVGLSRR